MVIKTYCLISFKGRGTIWQILLRLMEFHLEGHMLVGDCMAQRNSLHFSPRRPGSNLGGVKFVSDAWDQTRMHENRPIKFFRCQSTQQWTKNQLELFKALYNKSHETSKISLLGSVPRSIPKKFSYWRKQKVWLCLKLIFTYLKKIPTSFLKGLHLRKLWPITILSFFIKQIFYQLKTSIKKQMREKESGSELK